MKRSVTKRLLRSLSLLAFALLPFVLLEVGMRVVGYHPREDPYLAGFVGEPIFVREGDRMVPSPAHLVTWRAEPFPATPAPDALRVFVVGDSIAWGHRGNEFTDPLKPFAAYLEDLLRERLPGDDHRVVNCGARTFATQRVRRVVDEIVRYDPDVVVAYVGTSMHLETLLEAEWQAQRSGPGGWFLRLRFVGWLRDLLRPETGGLTLAQLRERDESLRAAFVDARSGLEGEADRDRLMATAERDLTAMADACAAADVPLVLATVPSDLRFPPMASHVAGGPDARAAVEDTIARTGALLADGDAAAAVALLEPALADHPEAAGLHFRLAQAREAQGDLVAARASYVAARDRDACPARALSAYNAIVRRLAAERPGVHLADVAALFTAAVPDGIPDERLFLDNCHPREPMHARIAAVIYDTLAEADLLRPRR